MRIEPAKLVSHVEGLPDPLILPEIVRESERIVDLQVRAFERAEARSDRLVTLGLGVLAGGLATGSLGLGRDGEWAALASLGIVAACAALNLAALVAFLGASPGLLEHHDVRVGPAPPALLRQAIDKAWTLGDHHLALIRSLADCHTENIANLARAVQARQRGLRFLLAAIAGYAAALFLIVASTRVA